MLFTQQCIVAEVGSPVTIIEGSLPYLLQTDFKIDFANFYGNIFGAQASNSSESHARNYECGKNLTDLLGSYTRRFLYDVDNFLNLQTTSYVRSVLTEAANTTTILTDHNRSKRDLGALALTMAVISILASGSALVYYNLSYQGLVDHIKTLYRALEQDRKTTNRIINDVRILRSGEGELAIRTNSLFEILYGLRLTHACSLLRQVTEVELTRINMEFKLFLSDIITENLSDRVIPVSLLIKLSQKGLLKGSLIEGDLTLFYKLCRLTLVNVDIEEETLLLTVTCPRLKKQTDLMTFSILSPPLTIRTEENKYLTRALDADFTDLTIPLHVLKRANFSLANMTFHDLREIRKMENCVNVHNRQFCRRLLPVPPATFRCLASMTKNGGGGTLCPQLESISTTGTLANYHLGRNYAVVFQPDNYDVRGNTGDLETVIHHARGSGADKYVCLVIPSKFQTVTILGDDQVTSFAQSITFVFDSVLGFKPEEVYVTKRLFSDDFTEDFKQPDKNFFSLNETSWQTLETLPDVFTRAMNLPSVDATVTTISLAIVLLIVSTCALIICCRRSMLCWRCLTATGSWVINGRGLFGVEATDSDPRRARSISPDEPFSHLDETRSTAPLTAPKDFDAAFAAGQDSSIQLQLPDKMTAALKGKENRMTDQGGEARQKLNPGDKDTHQGDV